ALLIEWTCIVCVARVGEVDRAAPREGHAVTSVARRQNAIEHVNTARHRLDEIMRRADTHQITRALIGKHWRRFGDDPEHHLLRFADGKAADRVAVKIHAGKFAGTFDAQREVVATLYDTKQCIAATT